MKTLVYNIQNYDKPFLEAANAGKHELHFTSEPLSETSVELAKGMEAVSLFSNDDASATVLKKLAAMNIKNIALRCVGHNHVDLKCARELGIRVANVPEYSPYAIAEHGVALLMALNRKIYESQLLMQMQDFRLDTLIGFDLRGKTVGVIGTGKIGFAFAQIMHGFGCQLLAFDPEPNPKAASIDMQYVPMEELLRQSDVISLNCPLNEHTLNLLDEAEFAQMKKGVFLINTARGGVLNTDVLLKYLENGTIGAAGLDVYDKELGLFFKDHRFTRLNNVNFARLRSFKNVLITGHQAFLTNEALGGIASTTIHNLDCWAAGKPSENEVQ
jgi:D-lactate dehydrogenase